MQARARWIWAIEHMFWWLEWRRILWSGEVTFLIGGRKCKDRVTRKAIPSRLCLIPNALRSHNSYLCVWSHWVQLQEPIVFISSSGKNGAFTQADYFAQVLKPSIKAMLADFEAVVAKTGQKAQFVEDGNSAHGHKSRSKVCVI